MQTYKVTKSKKLWHERNWKESNHIMTMSQVMEEIGSAGTLSKLVELTRKHFYSESIELCDDGQVRNSKGYLVGIRWEYRRGRFRLVSWN